MRWGPENKELGAALVSIMNYLTAIEKKNRCVNGLFNDGHQHTMNGPYWVCEK